MSNPNVKSTPIHSDERRSFEPPVLKRFGDLRQLTRQFIGMGGDAAPSIGMSRP